MYMDNLNRDDKEKVFGQVYVNIAVYLEEATQLEKSFKKRVCPLYSFT